MSDVVFEIKASDFCPSDNHFTMHLKVIKKDEVIFFTKIHGAAFSNATNQDQPIPPELLELSILTILRLYFSDEKENKESWKNKSQLPTGVRLVLKEVLVNL